VFEDIGDELARLQREVSGAVRLLTEAEARLPKHAEGADRTGAVLVRLGPDGLPVGVSIAPAWPEKLAPESVAQAVIEANHAATRARIAEWSRNLERDEWPAVVAHLTSPADGRRAAPQASTVAEPVPASDPRPLDELVEDTIRAFDTVGRPSLTARGTGCDGQPVVVLSPHGLVSCEAKPRWVLGRGGATLAEAFGVALRAARQDLTARAVAQHRQTDALARLFSEALAHQQLS
jgi:hypothetical protein